MKKINIIILFLAIISINWSCSKSYLDTKPTESAGTSTMFETTANAKLAINGIAKLMTNQLISSQGFNGEGTIKMYYGNYSGNHFFVNLPGWKEIINSEYNDAVDSKYAYYPWYYYYMLIGNANSVIHNIDNAAGDKAEVQYIKAQALTFRAYSYTMLVQIYGYRWSDSNNGSTNGVALRLDESTGNIPLSTLKECYDQIYKDLNEAIQLYTESKIQRNSKEFYTPDINVAYATYARAAINKQDYAKASEMAQKAYAGYPLMSVADYKAGFSNPTSEWIWGSYGASDETLHFYSYHAYIAYNASSSAVKSYPKCISKELYDKFPSTDIRKDLFLNPNGLKYNLKTGLADKELTALARKNFPDLNSAAKIYAYMNFKIKANDLPGVGNLNHFRSSEMYLIEAEAKYFLKDEAGAKAALETLNKTSKRDPSYSCTKTGTALLNEIKNYRALELWGEGFDWFDMKRWGDTIDRKTSDNGGNFISDLAVNIKPEEKNKWTWKIPTKETDFNGDIK